MGTVELKDSRDGVTFDLLSYARTRILNSAINENVSNYRLVRYTSANFVGVAVDVEYLFGFVHNCCLINCASCGKLI